jgi:uncharacterized protein (TIGR03435 family)
MMRNLLAERFYLQLRTLMKEFPAYALHIAKAGPKLKRSIANASSTPPRISGAKFHQWRFCIGASGGAPTADFASGPDAPLVG